MSFHPAMLAGGSNARARHQTQNARDKREDTDRGRADPAFWKNL